MISAHTMARIESVQRLCQARVLVRTARPFVHFGSRHTAAFDTILDHLEFLINETMQSASSDKKGGPHGVE